MNSTHCSGTDASETQLASRQGMLCSFLPLHACTSEKGASRTMAWPKETMMHAVMSANASTKILEARVAVQMKCSDVVVHGGNFGRSLSQKACKSCLNHVAELLNTCRAACSKKQWLQNQETTSHRKTSHPCRRAAAQVPRCNKHAQSGMLGRGAPNAYMFSMT